MRVQRSWLVLVAAAALTGVGAAAWSAARRRQPEASRPPLPATVVLNADPLPGPTPIGSAGGTEARAAAAPGDVPAAPAASLGRRVTFRADDRVALVNGVPVTGRDLLAVPSAAGADRSISPRLYRSLFERAIDRALVTAAAREQGLELTAEQKQQLAEYRATLAAGEAGARSVSGREPDQVDFEVRDAAGLLLTASLLERAGHSPDVSEADVERYGLVHPETAGEPAASVRARLAILKRVEYQTYERELLDALRATARIDVLLPPFE